MLLSILMLSICYAGELKKLLTAETGLQPAEQRLLYKGRDRKNGEFLDACGVKNRSKLVLAEDPTSLERRYLEMRKNARIQSAQRAITAVSMELDRLADQVCISHRSCVARCFCNSSDPVTATSFASKLLAYL